MFGAVSAFKAMKAARPDAKPDDPLFTETHREGIKELLAKANLRTDPDGRTRDAKSLRQTGISLRLDLGPNPDYRDIAKWARTSPAMIASFYDQTHPSRASTVFWVSGRARKDRSKTRPARPNPNDRVPAPAAGKSGTLSPAPAALLRMAPSFCTGSPAAHAAASAFRFGATRQRGKPRSFRQ
jgi:hypothetical protein